jgi:hypothetical protein
MTNPTPPASPVHRPATIGSLKIRNTSTVIDDDTKLCMLLHAQPKFGKTVVAASLDRLTKKYNSKPTLFIACEAADGGGTMSIQSQAVDFVMPQNWNEFCSVISELQSNETYGGVVLDNATDLVKRFAMPFCLKLPFEKGSAPASRALGVPAQPDYQTCGELLRGKLNELMNLTKSSNLKTRKHLVVCALQKNKTDRDGTLLKVQPDLPGAMSEDASAMFQTIAGIAIKTSVQDVFDPNGKKTGTARVSNRVLVTQGDGLAILGDRTGAFPKEGTTDLCEAWEKYFLPRIEQAKAGRV